MKFDRTTDESIAFLVHAFYEKVRRDPQLKPIFNQAIGGEWAAHMAKMADFWSAAMRISRRYNGDMLAAHRQLDGLSPARFERWLELFEQTIAEYFTTEAGAALRDRARKAARNLQLALSHLPDKAHRAALSGNGFASDATPTVTAALARHIAEPHT
jgi:hemoglobin